MAASDSDSVASTDGRSSSLTDTDTSTSESTSESSDSAADPADTDGVLQLKSHVPLTSHTPMPSFSVQDAPSDKSSCSSSSDTSSTTSRSAARPRVIKIKRLLESSQQHLSRHVDVAIRRKCQRCQYYIRSQELQRSCSWILPTTDEKCTWLMEHPGAETRLHEWGLGCHICRWAGLDTKMARCKIQTRTAKHINGPCRGCWRHKSTLPREVMSQRLQATHRQVQIAQSQHLIGHPLAARPQSHIYSHRKLN